MKTKSSANLIAVAVGLMAFCAQVQAVSPAPDGCYPNFTTAEGCNALNFLATGAGNTGLGWYSLFSDTDGGYNTGVGGGALALNNAYSNTAVGAGAMLLNTIGFANAAVGTDALLYNDSGDGNAVVGTQALLYNDSGDINTAVGTEALFFNISGDNNTAVGVEALFNTTGSGNIGIGAEAGFNMTASDNVITIGSPGDSDLFTASNRTYIGNIRGVGVGNSDGIPVLIDSDGQLGTFDLSRRFMTDIKPIDQTSEAILALKPVTFHYKNADTKEAASMPQFGLIAEDVVEVNPDLAVCGANGAPMSVRYDAVNVMLLNEFLKEHAKVEKQQATIAQLKKEIDAVVAHSKEQDSQIQSVRNQVQMSCPGTRVVVSDR